MHTFFGFEKNKQENDICVDKGISAKWSLCQEVMKTRSSILKLPPPIFVYLSLLFK